MREKGESMSVRWVNDRDLENQIISNQWTAILFLYPPGWQIQSAAMVEVVEHVANVMDDECVWVKINALEHPLTSKMFGVSAVPAIVLMLLGRERHRIIGAANSTQVLRRLRKVMKAFREE